MMALVGTESAGRRDCRLFSRRARPSQSHRSSCSAVHSVLGRSCTAQMAGLARLPLDDEARDRAAGLANVFDRSHVLLVLLKDSNRAVWSEGARVQDDLHSLVIEKKTPPMALCAGL